jgi:Sigma-70 factor, region 1.1
MGTEGASGQQSRLSAAAYRCQVEALLSVKLALHPGRVSLGVSGCTATSAECRPLDPACASSGLRLRLHQERTRPSPEPETRSGGLALNSLTEPERVLAGVADLTDPAIPRMIKLARKRGYITYGELDQVMPSEEFTSE